MINEQLKKLLSKWEIEYKKGFAKPMILFSLSKEPNYPYSLTRIINANSMGQINIAGSNIYPLLANLKEQGLVKSEKVAKESQTKNPEGKAQMRTVYSLTTLGEEFIKELRKSLRTFLGLIIELAE